VLLDFSGNCADGAAACFLKCPTTCAQFASRTFAQSLCRRCIVDNVVPQRQDIGTLSINIDSDRGNLASIVSLKLVLDFGECSHVEISF
jgi:hypothetical protein